MDLFGCTRTTSLGGKRYGLVIVDDYSRFTWVLFIAHKDETFKVFKKFYKRKTLLKLGHNFYILIYFNLFYGNII